ncbi:MAG: hypothetical protein DLM58_07855 [Pseudonocardiales bacterium]|nr:MAG: hypothetical protein DLM58_07855 [Pseudonocardiales bacterium]
MTYNPPPNVPAQSGYGASPAVPAQVNTAAILLFVSGGFGILGGLLLLALGSLGALFAAIGVFLLIVSAFEIWVGVALRQLKPWARTAAIALAAIGGLFSLISLLKGGYTSIIGLGLDIFIIYLLMQPPAVQAFANSNR